VFNVKAFWNRRGVRWLAILAAWPVIVLVVATQEYLYRAGFNVPVSWFDALRYPAVEYLFWLLLAPLIWDLAMRFHLDRRNWPRHAAILGGVALAVDLLHAVYRGALHDLVYPRHLAPPGMVIPPKLQLMKWYAVGNLIGDLWLFATIAALAHLAHYYKRYQSRERDLATARLEALEKQLQPHFLFNALNSIATLMHEDVEAADEMIIKLSALLRRTLQRGQGNEIPLREEVELLKLYLDIQQTRFQDRMTAEIRMEEPALDALVPRLILQPLVENAVRHGVSAKAAAGKIEVRGWRDGEWLRLAVSDDGPGLPETRPAGVGLSNTRARLAHHYDTACRFEIRNRAEGGVVAEIGLPYTAGNGHDDTGADR
jgi:two-component system, LytTR family, sensor kinase